MPDKPKTLQQIRETARIAAEEIAQTWPDWKKALSEPKEVTMRPADQGSRRDRPDWRY